MKINSDLDSIEELIREYQVILLSEKRIKVIETELAIEDQRLKDLALKVEQEYIDIVKLNQFNLRSLFNKILKSDTEQYEKEKQEYLLAVLEYNECEKIIGVLKYEAELLQQKATGSKELLNHLDNELNHYPDEYLYKKSTDLLALKSVNSELKNLIGLKYESEEALEMSKVIENSFNHMIRHLNEAQALENWGIYFKEIQERKEKQKSHIDKAHSYALEIKKMLIYLKAELADVVELKEQFNRTETLIRGFNIEYYTDLISDWIADKNLIETMSSTLTASKTIHNLEHGLKKIIKESEVEYTLQKKRRIQLIENIMCEK